VSRFRLNVGPLGLDIGRPGNIRLSLGWFGGHVCSSLASFGQSLPEEGVEDDAECHNNGAEPEDQDIADICPVTPERASVVVTTGRFVRSLGAIAEFPKKEGPRYLPEPLMLLSRTKAVCRSNHRSAGRVRDQPNSNLCFG
jgi:hypothetical protein